MMAFSLKFRCRGAREDEREASVQAAAAEGGGGGGRRQRITLAAAEVQRAARLLPQGPHGHLKLVAICSGSCKSPRTQSAVSATDHSPRGLLGAMSA